MKELTSRDLRESLTLLLPFKKEDGEGGWIEEWQSSHHLWAFIAPLSGLDMNGRYKIYIRSEIKLPPRIMFLWHLDNKTERLQVISKPVLTHQNRFLTLIGKENSHAQLTE